MERYSLTGQSPQRAVAPTDDEEEEEEEEERGGGVNPVILDASRSLIIACGLPR
jgi:hypothetical protein